MKKKQRIALIAHDHLKPQMIAWAKQNFKILEKHQLFATGTTGLKLREEVGLKVHRFKSGPLGGDQQIGAKIVEGKIDVVIFFWDPLQPQPHDVDVKALLRIGAVYDIVLACSLKTANIVIRGI